MRFPELMLDQTRPAPGDENGRRRSLARIASIGGALLLLVLRLLRMLRTGAGLLS